MSFCWWSSRWRMFKNTSMALVVARWCTDLIKFYDTYMCNTFFLGMACAGVDTAWKSHCMCPKLPKHDSTSTENAKWYTTAWLKCMQVECAMWTSQEGIASLHAYCKQKRLPFFTTRPKIHMQQEIMSLCSKCACMCKKWPMPDPLRMWMQDQLDKGSQYVLSPNCHWLRR